jgi:hypothetical protein
MLFVNAVCGLGDASAAALGLEAGHLAAAIGMQID